MMREIRAARKQAAQLGREGDALARDIDDLDARLESRVSDAQQLEEKLRVRTATLAATLEAVSEYDLLAATLAEQIEERTSAAPGNAATAVHLAHLEATTTEIAAECDFLRERIRHTDELIETVSTSRTWQFAQHVRRLITSVNPRSTER